MINEHQQIQLNQFYNYYLRVAGNTLLAFEYFVDNFNRNSYGCYIKYLTDTSYIGDYYYKGELLKNYTPPLMDKELFYKVQKLLKKASRTPNNNEDKPVTLFDGLLYCNNCHAKYCRKFNRYKNNIYISYCCSLTSRTP